METHLKVSYKRFSRKIVSLARMAFICSNNNKKQTNFNSIHLTGFPSDTFDISSL